MKNQYNKVTGMLVGPLLVMGLIGYKLGEYFNRKALCISICILLGFTVSCVDLWKMIKNRSDRSDN